MDVKIRNAGFDDLDSMVELLHELFAIEADFAFDRGKQYRGLSLMLDGCGKHRCIKVAVVNGRVTGMVTAQLLISTAQGGNVALIEDMVVASAFRCSGIGRKLMTAVERWALQRDVTRVQLLADRNNKGALDFYRKIGWSSTQLICLRKTWKQS